MHFSETMTYPAPIDTVNAMLVDRSFLEQRFAIKLFTEPTVTVDEGEKTSVSFGAGIDATALPPAFARFVKGDTKVTVSEVWDAPAGDSRTGTFDVSVSGVPMKLSATTTLKSEGDTTTRTIDGDIDVKIPLVGRKIEEKAVSIVPRLLSAESDAAIAYLEGDAEG